MNFPEQYRIKTGLMASEAGGSGMFLIPAKTPLYKYNIIIMASDGEGWDHVSVSIQNAKHCPKWEDMCKVKDLFWGKEETVVQFHPPESEYVSNHKYCLHLWRKQGFEMPLPPSIMVGFKTGMDIS